MAPLTDWIGWFSSCAGIHFRSGRAMILLEFDKKGAEWFVVAYLSEDAKMMKAHREGVDVHATTGSLLTGLSLEEVLKESAAVGHATDQKTIEEKRAGLGIEAGWLPRAMSIRQAGKKTNHGGNYGEGPNEFSMQNEMPLAEAKILLSKYLREAYPGIPQWHKRIQETLREDDRVLKNCFGRKVRFQEEWGHRIFKQAYAFQAQSTIFDVTSQGFVKAYEERERGNPVFAPMELLSHTHDSNLVQYPDADLPRLAAFASRFGLGFMNPHLSYNQHDFQIDTTLQIGYDWGSMIDVDLVQNEEELVKNLEEAVEKIRGKAPEKLARNV